MEGYLKAAEESDMDILFEWANDPIVRQNSFHSERILYEDHKKWFYGILEGSGCRQYIYICNNEKIGQARITVNGFEAEISYSICPQKRNQGHGAKSLQLIYRQVKEEFPQIRKLIGKVKPENIASAKAFLHAGYGEQYSVYERQMELQAE